MGERLRKNWFEHPGFCLLSRGHFSAPKAIGILVIPSCEENRKASFAIIFPLTDSSWQGAWPAARHPPRPARGGLGRLALSAERCSDGAMHDTLAISKYFSEVHADWRVSEFAFPSNVVPQQHWPIPFFGNPASAVVATVGVNPSSTEFRPGRNWSATKDRIAWKERLKNYFNASTPVTPITLASVRPPPHEWFEPWSLGLALLGLSYGAGTAAHFDVSYRPTTAMLKNPATDREEFRRMVEQDVKWFFQLLPLCPKLRLLLISGPIVRNNRSTESLAQFLKNHVPPNDFTVSQDGNFWVCKRLDTETGINLHEVPMTGEKCFTTEVLKNLHVHRLELLQILQQ